MYKRLLYVINMENIKYDVNNNNWLSKNSLLFISAWILQFIGHYIEGNRPALTDSLIQAFLVAPIFVLIDIKQLCNE